MGVHALRQIIAWWCCTPLQAEGGTAGWLSQTWTGRPAGSRHPAAEDLLLEVQIIHIRFGVTAVRMDNSLSVHIVPRVYLQGPLEVPRRSAPTLPSPHAYLPLALSTGPPSISPHYAVRMHVSEAN